MASRSSCEQVDLKKFDNICRTCLSKTTGSDINCIFDMKLGKYCLLDILTEITGLKIEYGDRLPAYICQECRQNAENAFLFRTKSQESDIALREVFRNNEKNDTDAEPHQLKNMDVKTENFKFDFDYLDEQFMSLSNGSDEFNTAEENIKKEGQCSDSTEIMKEDKETCINIKENIKKEGQCSDSTEIMKEDKETCINIKAEYENNSCFICNMSYKDLTKHMWESHMENIDRKKRGRPKLTKSGLKQDSVNIKCDNAATEHFKCTFCNELCGTKEDFESHIIEHKDIKVSCCILCKKMYINKYNFEIHLCIDDKQEFLNLRNGEKCIKESIKKNDFVSEMFLEELIPTSCDLSGLGLFQVCNACDRLFSCDSDLSSHIDAEHPELSLRCNFCNKVFATLRTAARHRSVCKEVERNYACPTCGLKFAYEISLNKHILRHHEGQSVSVKFMDTKANLNDKQYQCDTCNKCFFKKDLLARHTKRHMSNETLYECDVCKKRFHRRDNLSSHKRVHEIHREKNPSNCLCLYCGRSFSNSSNLIVHMRRHTGEKPYKCDFCGKGFPRSSDLQCHRRSHTGEKPCICRVCGKGFARSNKLSRHMRVHTGQRPYKCTYCDKAFSQSNDLTLHVRRHTGDKPYICEVCGDRFIQGSALHNHRRAHGHFPPSCETQVSVAYTVQGITHTNT